MSEQPAPAPKIDLRAEDVYKLKVGPHATDSVDFTLTDAKRDSDLPVRVTFPKSDGHQRFPTIVFSHGAGGSGQAYLPLVSHWVSHGYICIQPTHGDSISLLTTKERRGFRSPRDFVGRGLAEHQLTRPADIRLILDSLDVIEDQIPGEHPRIQRNHIGIGGHSFGAHTTAMIAGISLRMPSSRPRITVTDDRPRAFLMISPQGTGGQIDDQSWTNIDRPTMVVTGTNDKGRNGQSHEWRLEVFEHLRHDDSYLTFIDGASHGFGGISSSRASRAMQRMSGRNEANPDHLSCVRTATLAFWDAYLRDSPEARMFLNSDKLRLATKNGARITTPTETAEYKYHSSIKLSDCVDLVEICFRQPGSKRRGES